MHGPLSCNTFCWRKKRESKDDKVRRKEIQENPHSCSHALINVGGGVYPYSISKQAWCDRFGSYFARTSVNCNSELNIVRSKQAKSSNFSEGLKFLIWFWFSLNLKEKKHGIKQRIFGFIDKSRFYVVYWYVRFFFLLWVLFHTVNWSFSWKMFFLL